MKYFLIRCSAGICLFVSAAALTRAEVSVPMNVITEPNVMTDRMGGVDVPAAEVLKKMHGGQYVLRAAGGKLTKLPVEKVVLPHSDDMSPQGAQVDLGPDGVVYVRESHILCKSIDGGRTWTSQPVVEQPEGINLGGRWKVLRDGTFISVGLTNGKDEHGPAIVWASHDEGQSWTKRAEIPIEMNLASGEPYNERYVHRGLNRLADDTLLWAVELRDGPLLERMMKKPVQQLKATATTMYFFQSTDGGHTWQGPILINDWGSEGGAALLPSGRVFATLRYQRTGMPDDPPDLEKRNRSISKGWPWKHLFLMDSEDGGLSWSPPRQLTTVFGQTFGRPAAQSDGTVVVVHDTRYGPGPAGSRAMISRDEGQTWLDEVYYLDYTTWPGSYTASVVFQDDTILTIAGSSQVAAVMTNTDMVAIRWKPVKD